MDAVSDPQVQTVVFMKSAQVGGTEVLNNVIGYYIDQDPSPMLAVMPTLEIGHAWSKDRLAPMLRDTPALHGKVKDAKARDSGNTLLHKTFPGGHITIAGANSPASLASRPVRVVIQDEIDRFPPSAGAEGDPIKLADKRTQTFWNRKRIRVSTPTIKDLSPVEREYNISNMQRWHVPCPHCGEHQILEFEYLKWPEGRPADAFYTCRHNGCVIEEKDKNAMVAAGEWRAEKPGSLIAGFHICEIYSPWSSFAELAQGFLEVKDHPELLKTWVNTALAQTWEEKGGGMDDGALSDRREVYAAPVPDGAVMLIAGVDVQDDRLEIETVAFGKHKETWGIDYTVLHGDPGNIDLWDQLDDYLLQSFQHETGAAVRIYATGIDTGGHFTQQVYDFCKSRWKRRVFALKGVGGFGKPLINKPSRNNAKRVRLFSVGVDTGKELVNSNLKIAEPGPGYCHFPDHYDGDFFDQLTAEKLITKYTRGRATMAWVLKSAGRRNEALDIRVYVRAVYELVSRSLHKLARGIEARAIEAKENPVQNAAAEEAPGSTDAENTEKKKTKKKRTGRKRSGWVKNW